MQPHSLDRRGMWDDLPRSIQLIIYFIDRIGFPIAAFFLIAWFVNGTMKDNTIAMRENTRTITQLVSKLDNSTVTVRPGN